MAQSNTETRRSYS